MSPYKKKQKDKKRKNLFRKWHRRIGFTAAIFLINLAVTGILLNHSDDLELHKQYISSDWIVTFYGIKAPTSAQCLGANPSTKNICQLGEKIYLAQQPLIESPSKLIGLLEFDDLLYLATSQELFIYTKEFELVEVMDKTSGLPTPIRMMIKLDQPDNEISVDGQINEMLIIMGSQKAWRFDQVGLKWKVAELMAIMPPRLHTLEQEKLAELQNIYLDHQLTYLKFIQDLHSGRIFFLSGKLVTDLAGIIIIVLIFSGFYAWQKRKKIN